MQTIQVCKEKESEPVQDKSFWLVPEWFDVWGDFVEKERALEYFLMQSHRGRKNTIRDFDDLCKSLGYMAYTAKYFYGVFRKTEEGLKNKDVNKIRNLLKKSKTLKPVIDSSVERVHELYVLRDALSSLVTQPITTKVAKKQRATRTTFHAVKTFRIIGLKQKKDRTCTCGNFEARCICVHLPCWL